MFSRSSLVNNTLENWLFKKTTVTYNFNYKACYPWIFLLKPFYIGPKTFWVILNCLTKVATEIILCRLKIIVHEFPGGTKHAPVMCRSCFLCFDIYSLFHPALIALFGDRQVESWACHFMQDARAHYAANNVFKIIPLRFHQFVIILSVELCNKCF